MNNIFIDIMKFRMNLDQMESIRNSEEIFNAMNFFEKIKLRFKLYNYHKRVQHLSKDIVKNITESNLNYEILYNFAMFTSNFPGVTLINNDTNIRYHITRNVGTNFVSKYHITLTKFTLGISISIYDGINTKYEYPLKEYSEVILDSDPKELVKIYQFKKLIADIICEYLRGDYNYEQDNGE